MKEHPTLFTGGNVLAILDDRKTQTRRIVAPNNSTVLGCAAARHWPGLRFEHAIDRERSSLMQIIAGDEVTSDVHLAAPYQHPDEESAPPESLPIYRVRPKMQIGDRLWVKETHYRWGKWVRNGLTKTGRPRWRFKVLHKNNRVFFHASTALAGVKRTVTAWHKRPSIFLPRWASRLTLEVTDVRVERLQAISKADAIAEGILRCGPNSYTDRDTVWNSASRAYQALWETIHGPGSWEPNPWVYAYTFKRLPTP